MVIWGSRFYWWMLAWLLATVNRPKSDGFQTRKEELSMRFTLSVSNDVVNCHDDENSGLFVFWFSSYRRYECNANVSKKYCSFPSNQSFLHLRSLKVYGCLGMILEHVVVVLRRRSPFKRPTLQAHFVSMGSSAWFMRSYYILRILYIAHLLFLKIACRWIEGLFACSTPSLSLRAMHGKNPSIWMAWNACTNHELFHSPKPTELRQWKAPFILDAREGFRSGNLWFAFNSKANSIKKRRMQRNKRIWTTEHYSLTVWMHNYAHPFDHVVRGLGKLWFGTRMDPLQTCQCPTSSLFFFASRKVELHARPSNLMPFNQPGSLLLLSLVLSFWAFCCAAHAKCLAILRILSEGLEVFLVISVVVWTGKSKATSIFSWFKIG